MADMCSEHGYGVHPALCPGCLLDRIDELEAEVAELKHRLGEEEEKEEKEAEAELIRLGAKLERSVIRVIQSEYASRQLTRKKGGL